jgi:type IV secretion system protein VirB6
MACPTFTPASEFLTRALWTIDCYAQSLGENGYRALAAPGSAASLTLTAVLTIFVAIFGYRLLFGDLPDVREGVVGAAKVGIVLALATSWPVFQTLVYDVTLRGPAQLASTLGRPAGLPGAEGGLIARLQGVDNLFAELMIIGTGKPPWAEAATGTGGALTPAQQQQETTRLRRLQERPPWSARDDAKLVGQARTSFLVGAIAAFGAVRLLAGLLLALGPLFALFLLFDHTRGLFDGWIRGLSGAALGALATAIILTVELAILEPWLATVVAQRRADIPTPNAPVELLVATLGFGLTLLGSVIGVAKVARGFRAPSVVRTAPSRWLRHMAAELREPASPLRSQEEARDQRARAATVADALVAAQRREAGAAPLTPVNLTAQMNQARNGRSSQTIGSAGPGGDAGARRRTRGRVSGGAERRDRRK